MRLTRMRYARAMPRPRPRREPIAVWVESLLAADLRASRSEGSRLDRVST